MKKSSRLAAGLLVVALFSAAPIFGQQQSSPQGGTASPAKPAEAARPAAEAKPAAAAAPTTGAAPSVDQLIEKHAQAVGGKAAVEKHKSVVAKGTFELPAMGVTGTVERHGKAPNKFYTIVSIPSFGDVRQGFDGTTGWAQDPNSGTISTTSGVELSEQKINAEFYRDVRLKELFPQMTYKGKETLNGREFYVIDAPTAGVARKLYFDSQTGLLGRISAERETSGGKQLYEETYEDYKDVDGIKIAHTVRFNTPQYNYVFKFDDVKHDAPVDDAKFAKP